MNITMYLEMINDHTELRYILSKRYLDAYRDHDAATVILLTWHLSFKQIKKNELDAAEVLSSMSLLDKDRTPDFLLNRNLLSSDSTSTATTLFDKVKAKEARNPLGTQKALIREER